jgi:putative Mg2+ transporter-C (MgtC) family protein
MSDPAQWAMLGEIALAMLLGAVIGLDREVSGKPAGLRTHMLVAGAAALLVALGFTLMEAATHQTPDEVIAADPIRIVQAIIIGIGFIGGGTIFRRADGGEVHGLTTAASLLVSSGLGVAVALRQFTLAVGTAVLTAAVLRLVWYLERRFDDRARDRQ